MERRRFLGFAGASAAVLLTGLRKAAGEAESAAAGWRTFELTTRLEITGADGVTRAWVPLPLMTDVEYQRRLGDTWESSGPEPRLWRDDQYDAGCSVRSGPPRRRRRFSRW